MATFRLYRCKKCGYEIQTDPHGHYGLMSGEYYDFRCVKCKEIVSIHVDNLARDGYFPTCPECGASNEDLYTWNATEGKCPKCNGEIEEQIGCIIMAD